MSESKLKNFSDQELESHLQSLSRKARAIDTEIILGLREVEERSLYLKRGFDSMFSYLTGSLKFGEAAAYQRMAALKALKGQKKTQVVDRLNRGALNLTALSEAK